MSRTAKGPRLYLRKGRIDQRSKKRVPDRYFIRDGEVERSTGCGLGQLDEAQQLLAKYIQSKWTPPVAESDPEKVQIADALALYARERGPKLQSDPATMRGFTKALLDWWAGRSLADIRRSSCEAYAKHRSQQPIRHGKTGRLVSLQTARRELELLSAAVGYWHKEHHLRYPTPVVLPDKAATNRDALTRGEAAKLLIAARGNRFQDGHWVPLQESSRANRVHLVRFILLGLYTGSRSDVSMRLRWTTSLTDPWVELDRMTLHRQGKRESVASNKRRPPVRLSNRLRRHLARWQREDQGMECDLVLHHGGRQIASVRTGFAGCVADAGLSPDITPHWLRHTAATWLMDANVPLWEAASYVGMTTATLEKHYGHHRPDHQAAARKAMR